MAYRFEFTEVIQRTRPISRRRSLSHNTFKPNQQNQLHSASKKNKNKKGPEKKKGPAPRLGGGGGWLMWERNNGIMKMKKEKGVQIT